MRLIDADELKSSIIAREFYSTIEANILSLIDNAPTVEPQKVVIVPHDLIEKLALCVVDTIENIDWDKAIEAYKERPQGEWSDLSTDGRHTGWIVCSVCGQEPPSESNLSTNFCPNCGADMRKDDCDEMVKSNEKM